MKILVMLIAFTLSTVSVADAQTAPNWREILTGGNPNATTEDPYQRDIDRYDQEQLLREQNYQESMRRSQDSLNESYRLQREIERDQRQSDLLSEIERLNNTPLQSNCTSYVDGLGNTQTSCTSW